MHFLPIALCFNGWTHSNIQPLRVPGVRERAGGTTGKASAGVGSHVVQGWGRLWEGLRWPGLVTASAVSIHDFSAPVPFTK